MQFLGLLKRLNAYVSLRALYDISHANQLSSSQQSIQKVVGYALKYFSRCGEDLWDCIVEECQKVGLFGHKSQCFEIIYIQGSINNRINILYFLDSLCETSLLAKAHGAEGSQNSSYYVDYVSRDLGKIVEYVVPDGRQGLPNLMSTKQVSQVFKSRYSRGHDIIADTRKLA